MMHRMRATRPPPVAYFLTSAVFHYLGPSLAVLLFAHVGVLGVAWLRIAGAAAVFLLWRGRRALRVFRGPGRWTVVALGAALAAMNCMFYLALDRLPLATVGAIEFLGTVVVAAGGARTPRNLVALLLAVGGVLVLTDVRFVASPLGFAFAFANCAGFVLYVVLGHRVAGTGSGIDRLGAGMLVAAVLVTPLGIGQAATAFVHPWWLLWGVGVGLCSSVIPYVTDQLAMARLPRATFALMLTLLPATATVIGLIVLDQVPTAADLLGIALVIAGVAAHRERQAHADEPAPEVQN